MTPPRFTTVLRVADELPEPGDLWRVIRVDADTPGAAVLERVQADPQQFRSPGDGLWPRVPKREGPPLSDAEARLLSEAIDAALDRGRRFWNEEAPFLPFDRIGPGLERALRGQVGPLDLSPTHEPAGDG